MTWSLPTANEDVILISPPVSVLEQKTLLYAHRTYSENFFSLRLFNWLQSRCRQATYIHCVEDARSKPLFRGYRTAGRRSAQPERMRCYYFGLDEAVLEEKLRAAGKPHQIWITTLFPYDTEVIRETIHTARRVYPGVPVIVGGGYASLVSTNPEDVDADHFHQGLIPEAEGECAVQKGTMGLVVGGRGCANRCSYCAFRYLENTKPYVAEAHRVLGRVDEMIANGMSFLMLYTPNLFRAPNAEKTEAILEGLGQRDLTIVTWAGLEPKTVNPRRARLLYEAGAIDQMIPLQTLDPELRRKWGRRESVDTYLDAVAMMRDAGYTGSQLASDVLIGHPDQSLEEAVRSVCYVWSQGLTPLIFPYTLVPGSDDAERYKEIYDTHTLEEMHPYLWPFADPKHGAKELIGLSGLARVKPELVDHALETLSPDSALPGLIRRYLDEFGFDVPQWRVNAPLPELTPGRYASFLSHPWELVLTLTQEGHPEEAARFLDACEEVTVCEANYLEIPQRLFAAGLTEEATRALRGASRWLPLPTRNEVRAVLNGKRSLSADDFARFSPLIADALQKDGHNTGAALWREPTLLPT